MCGIIFFYLKKLYKFLLHKLLGFDHHSLPSAKLDIELNKTHTFPTSFSTSFNTPQTSNTPYGAFPGSSRSSHAVCNKPILSRDPSHSTSLHAKSKYHVGDKGSNPLYVIPEDIKCLIKQDIVPDVLKKPLTPQTYKDYFATLLYAEDFYLEVAL